ncbi:MAG TPA: thiamine phosphate synthase [Marinagarivorans sp.]
MLYAITDDHLMPGPALLAKSEAALKGGCQWLQYRSKSLLTPPERVAAATALTALCRRYGAKLIINDDVELAEITGADGVHLGQGDGDPRLARKRLGNGAIIGVTCHDQLALAQRAIDDGASYVAFGRFFPSQTKPNAQAAPFSLLNQARQLSVPVTAIGGITLENAHRMIEAGASVIAVCHSLFAGNDVEARARNFCRVINP